MIKTLIILLTISCVIVGCITTKTADTTTTKIDLDTTIALTQLSINAAQQGFQMWMEYQEKQEIKDQQQYEKELARRQENIALLQSTLDKLIAMKAVQVTEATSVSVEATQVTTP